MDPIQNLDDQVRLAQDVKAIWNDPKGDGEDEESPGLSGEQDTECAYLADELADRVLDLKAWLDKGGFAPHTALRAIKLAQEILESDGQQLDGDSLVNLWNDALELSRIVLDLPERMVLVILEGDDDHLALYNKPQGNRPGKVTILGSEMEGESFNDHLAPSRAAEKLGEHLDLPVMQLDLRNWRYGDMEGDRCVKTDWEKLGEYEAVGLLPEDTIEGLIHLLETGAVFEHPELFPITTLDEEATRLGARYAETGA